MIIIIKNILRFYLVIGRRTIQKMIDLSSDLWIFCAINGNGRKSSVDRV